jgi:hypothetical protein
MKPHPNAVKVAALASSLALAGAYVGCRTIGREDASSPPVDPAQPSAQAADSPAVLPSSKRAEIETPQFLGGSKSMAPLVEPPPPKPAPQQHQQPR